MTPGRFQKLTRLQRARALLAAGSHTVSSAAIAVGSLSVPQFCRDYRRQYGTPPSHDARSLRGA